MGDLAEYAELIGAVRARWGKISKGCVSVGANGDPSESTGLDALIRAIEVDHADKTALRNGTTLSRMLRELAELRRAMLEEVPDHLGRPMTLEESLRLNGALDRLTAAAVEQVVADHYRGIEQAVDGQTAFINRLSHDVRGQLNAILLRLQVLQREMSGVSEAQESLRELDHLRRSILSTVKKMDGGASRETARRADGSVHAG